MGAWHVEDGFMAGWKPYPPEDASDLAGRCMGERATCPLLRLTVWTRPFTG